MTLREITRNILCENVSNDDINDVINGHNYVVVNYDGDDGTHKGKRMIQPVAYGLTTAGNPVIRAYESFGDTKTSVPRWKYFRVDRISSWKNTGKKFLEPAEKFNPDDDRSMSVVYNIAKFGNDENEMDTPESSPKMKSDEKPEIFRTDSEMKFDKLRKQLQNPLTISDFKTQNAFGDTKNDKQVNGPKTKKDAKKGSDDIYTDEYNYNVFDNALSASGKKTKRNGHYYFHNRKNGRFAKGNILDEPSTNDTTENGNMSVVANDDENNLISIEDLRRAIGDTSKPISFRELQDRIRNLKR